MTKSVMIGLAIVGLLVPFMGCGDNSDTKSVFVEDEMAKYRSTPEQIAGGMKSSGAVKPEAADLKAMEKSQKANLPGAVPAKEVAPGK